MSKVILYILNVVYALFGVLLLLEGIGFYIYVCMFTSLRNSNHYLLDFKLYWPQILPFVFGFSGLFVMFVCCCGCCSAAKKNQGFTIMHALFTLLTIGTVIASCVLALVYGDSDESHKFLKDALYDGFSEAKTNTAVSASFSSVESWLQCCGVDGSSDYKGSRKSLPNSCCGFDINSTQVCEYTSKTANERHGCAPVGVSYSIISLKALGATAALTAFFGLLTLIASLSMGIRKRRPAVYEATDIETKKGLL